MPRRFRLLAVLVPAVLTLAFALVSDAIERGENALIQRRYAEAVGHLESALDEVAEADQDRVLLLLARARWLAGDVDGAVEDYRRLVRDFPSSSLVPKAELQQAEALASAKRFREAAALYRDQIERLTGAERKEEIAATYLGLADKALAAEPPDHGRAVTFYDLALDLGLSDARARSVRLLAAEARLAAGQHEDAIRRLEPLVAELQRERDRLRAMLALGRARNAAGQKGQARAVLRDVIAADADAAEAADAAYEIALTFGVPTPAAGELDRAVSALRELEERFPEHPQAKIADYLVARCQLHGQRTEQALASLREFLGTDRGAPLDERAKASALVGDVLFAQGKLEDAIGAWHAYLQAYPAHEEWERVQRAIVDCEYARAVRAFEGGKERFGEARERFEAFARAYPLDPRNPEILLALGEMLFAEEVWDAAREAYARCVAKYPGHDASSRAQYRIGEIFETETFNYQQALEAYQAVTWGPWAPRAKARIELLKDKSLHLKTPRTYRTGEPAAFVLTSRNIEEVRVRVHRLDLETWFRATHTAGAVERLDIEIIEPDKTFDSKVDDYQRFRETEREVDIGYREPGAYVVKVDDRELEATTMVLVTDIGLIAKTSRHELFVFTQNLKEDRVEGGVRVVLSDGEKVVTEGQTGADGVWRYRGDELQRCASLRAFVVNAAGSGAGTLDLDGLGYTPGLTAKGFLFTDRPTYEPGQTVHVKGIVRDVESGVYRLPEGDGAALEVVSAAGRLIARRPIRFTDFGTFATEIELPADADLGEWRLQVRRETDTFTAAFEVARYELPRLLVTVAPARSVVFRGEPIEGEVEVQWFFGEPAIDKTVAVTLKEPDGRVRELVEKTNAAGVVRFAFATDEFPEEALAVLDAVVVEENARSRTVVPVVSTEFTPSLSLVRDVFLAGEPFDVTVAIEDRSGAKLARRGELVLLRRETDRGRVAEVEVARRAFETRAADGEAAVTLRAEQGGSYVVRAESVDRFGQVVTAAKELTISGDDDRIRLRLLSDRQSYEVGDTVRVKVANRAGARLALRTVQGDGILAYETVRLPEGESEHELALETLHAPNFVLALAMIDGTVLRTAEREFLVARELELEVRPKVETARPGDTVEVEIEAREPGGAPVEAEVALALVDASLLEIYADRAPAIGAFFYGQRRETAFRTTSSCDWSYEGGASEVSQELLAEELRERARTRTDEDQRGILGFVGDGFLPPRIREMPTGEQDLQQSAFDSNAWNSAIGLGGGAGGAWGGRFKGGRGEIEAHNQRMLRYFHGQELEQPDFFSVFGSASPLVPTDEPRTEFSELGGWISSVRTDASGRATVSVELPHNTTAWRITARGATRDTWVGEARGTLKTAKPAQVGLAVPPVLTEGDRTQLRAHVHNTSADAFDARLELAMRRGAAEPRTEARDVRVEPGRERVESFALTADAVEPWTLEAKLSGGGEDALAQRVVVMPFGVEHRDGRAGVLVDAVAFDLALPAGREYTATTMRIEIGPDPGRDLIAAALGAGYRPWNCRRVDLTHRSLASRGLGALAVLEFLERNASSGPADRARLEAVVTSCLTSLLAVQLGDGSLAWIGRQQGDLVSTAAACRFFAACVRRGLTQAESARDQAAEWLLQQLRTGDAHERVYAAEALAACGRARFETLNSLHRRRASMTLEQLARLGLGWQAADRAGMAGEVVEVLRTELELADEASPADIAAAALAARVLVTADPRDRDARRVLDWLERQRRGASWGTPEATAAALEAIVAAGGRDLGRPSEAEIDVLVNGEELATLPPTFAAETAGFDVPGDWLRPGANRVELRLRGRGKAHFSAVLRGFARGFTEADRADRLVRVTRKYHPAYLRHDGEEIRPGFGVVSGEHERFENELRSLPVGRAGRAVLTFHARDEALDRGISPLVVEEPIPAGCTVPRGSLRGNFDHAVVEPDRLVLYFRDGVRAGTVEYELQARFPGSYRALPTRVFGAARPDLLAFGPAMQLDVPERGAAADTGYRMTPDELFRLGKALFEAGELARAGEHLRQLADGWALRDEPFKEVARMMLFVSIAAGDSKGTVRAFEELKDRQPDLVIPFDDILAVGQAYIDIGEFEAALLVFRATAEASFLKEAAVATTLEGLGEVKASLRFLHRLLGTYPDLNTMRVSLYAIGQKLAAVAAGIADGQPVDERVGSPTALRVSAVETFRDFLVWFPDDPLAEEVSFAWATTLVEADDLDGALRVAEAALARYPGSSLEDELLYTVGYAQFVRGRGSEAFPVLERVATEEFAAPNGGRRASENRYHAIYLQGQIHHALGEPAEALALYDRVVDRFSDAREAADYFRRQELALPEVSRFAQDEAIRVELAHRNLSRVALEVYRVDLMRLYVLQKSLNNIRDVMLHGIAPFAELALELGDGKDYRDRTTALELPLEEPGAYLVVARSGDLVASGMVLRSDLAVEAQESPEVGRLRVNVKRGDAFVRGAHVKVVGSGDGKLRSGATDMRGIFTADGLVGRATVIVALGGEHAFFRGEVVHQAGLLRPEPQRSQTRGPGGGPTTGRPSQQQQQEKVQEFEALFENLEQNSGNRLRQIQWLQQEVLNKKQQGVEVYRTK